MTATVLWPSALPAFVLADEYSEAPRMANVEFETDTGPPIERPRGTVKLIDIAVSTIMSDEQVATFEDFVFSVLEQATKSFYYLHPRTQEQVKVRLKGRPPYQIMPFALEYWKVSFSLVVIGA